ncbi:esterase/lipase family protein [Sulfurospirillum arcachonense]|uniref:esterase/lipase family protein n=1 Tax=Sulfurospirillum arcachonense TaxID=57666 RepID=UPI0004686FA1|nr:hypothetical protein [Sulfurospirillum arcachonense]
MKLVFVHGWSVTSTETYGELPQVLEREADASLHVEIENIYLGEYISFHDEVNLEDIARAFEKARVEKLGDESFACITHSTGGPVMRLWIDLFYKNDLTKIPLTHLVMLAPANHGSALAVLGKEKVGRIKAWWNDIEPGVGVLNWLQLGSQGQWNLNSSFLDYSYEDTFYPFVLSGEKIDEHFYDFINHYLVEKGSDGVVRLSGANMNYQKVVLKQDCNSEMIDAKIAGTIINAYPLKVEGEIRKSTNCAFEVIKGASHSGDKYGIMNSVKKKRVVKPVVNSILKSLHVKTFEEYNKLSNEMIGRTKNAQAKSDKYIMFVFNVQDNLGNEIHDYDMLLLAGDDYDPNKLPKGFFVDRQKNNLSGNLIYYFNYSKLKEVKDGKLGIRIVARPDEGFSHYLPAEFRSEDIKLEHLLLPNQTVMVDVILQRRIAENTFVLDTVKDAKKDFIDRKPNEEKL